MLPTSLWKTNTYVYQKSHLWPTMKAGTSFEDFRDILHRNVSGLIEELHVPVNWHHFLRTESWIFWTVHHPIATNAYFKDTSTGWVPFQESWGWKSAETSPSRTRVPLGAQRNSGGKRGGWWWKMDVCGGRVPYGTLPGSNNPGSGSQIPLVWTISRKTRELTTSQHLQFLLALPLCFSFVSHSTYFHVCIFPHETKGTFVWQSSVSISSINLIFY